MDDYRELSRLPDDEAYWDELEARVMSGLGPRVARTAEWWAPLATRAYALGAIAVAAGVAALLLVPGRSAAPPAVGAGLFRMPDDDPAFVAVLSAPAPPLLGTLLLPEKPE